MLNRELQSTRGLTEVLRPFSKHLIRLDHGFSVRECKQTISRTEIRIFLWFWGSKQRFTGSSVALTSVLNEAISFWLFPSAPCQELQLHILVFWIKSLHITCSGRPTVQNLKRNSNYGRIKKRKAATSFYISRSWNQRTVYIFTGWMTKMVNRWRCWMVIVSFTALVKE